MGLIAKALLTLVGFIAAVGVAAISRLIAEDVMAWAPSLTERLIDRAVRRLPGSQRQRFSEEWRCYINDTPGELTKFMVALSFQRASWRMEQNFDLGVARSDVDAVENIVRSSNKTFYRQMAMLPQYRRQAMYAVWAFCRVVDDLTEAAENSGDVDTFKRRLNEWRARIAGLYDGEFTDALTRVLLRAIEEFNLQRADFDAVIRGMEMDAEVAIVAPDLPMLDRYCDRVSAAVGRL